MREISSKTISYEKSQPNPNLELVGFGCDSCGWTTSELQLFKALPKFGEHNGQMHLKDPGQITYRYRPLKHQRAHSARQSW